MPFAHSGTHLEPVGEHCPRLGPARLCRAGPRWGQTYEDAGATYSAENKRKDSLAKLRSSSKIRVVGCLWRHKSMAATPSAGVGSMARHEQGASGERRLQDRNRDRTPASSPSFAYTIFTQISIHTLARISLVYHALQITTMYFMSQIPKK